MLSNIIIEQEIDGLIGKLPDREQEVLRLRYGLEDGQERTLREIGTQFEVTRERIRQIEADALRHLREWSRHVDPAQAENRGEDQPAQGALS